MIREGSKTERQKAFNRDNRKEYCILIRLTENATSLFAETTLKGDREKMKVAKKNKNLFGSPIEVRTKIFQKKDKLPCYCMRNQLDKIDELDKIGHK